MLPTHSHHTYTTIMYANNTILLLNRFYICLWVILLLLGLLKQEPLVYGGGWGGELVWTGEGRSPEMAWEKCSSLQPLYHFLFCFLSSSAAKREQKILLNGQFPQGKEGKGRGSVWNWVINTGDKERAAKVKTGVSHRVVLSCRYTRAALFLLQRDYLKRVAFHSHLYLFYQLVFMWKHPPPPTPTRGPFCVIHPPFGEGKMKWCC